MACGKHLLGVLGLVVALATAALVQAQPPGRGPGGPGGPGGFGMFGRGGGDQTLRLLGLPEVQQELELVDEQKTKLKAIGDEIRQRVQQEFAGLRQLDPEQRRAKFEEAQKKAQAWGEESRKRVDEILLPHQLDRLEEIRLQVRGTSALADAKVQEDLGLTAEQKTKLRELREKAEADIRGAFEGLRELSEEARRAKMAESREKMQKAIKDVAEQAMGVLTDQQRAKFEEMKGKKIEIQWPQRGPQGRPGPAPKP